MVCGQPGCGYVFPEGMQIGNKCPNCDKSPFYFPKRKAIYTKEEFEGRKIFPQIMRGEISLFERAA